MSTGRPTPAFWARARVDNRTLRDLPVESHALSLPAGASPVRETVPEACFSRVRPTPVDDPRLVAAVPDVLEGLLGARLEHYGGEGAEAEAEEADLAAAFSGNEPPEGWEPASHCYCGFQFGYFSGQLGDGAAMYMGEAVAGGGGAGGEGGRWEFQLKGSGLTPYSRQADGRKVLRSSVREFLASEAMHGLGVPTTRAAALVTSGTRVVRDPFYDGNAREERASVVCRVARTFIRFGSFEVCRGPDPRTGRAGPSHGRPEVVERLLRYTVDSFFPQAGGDAAAFFREVVRRTARLAAAWQAVGFCHGVLNTDNMSIVGDTLDFGPYGWMERFDRAHVCNTSDDGGRYAYNRQPDVCLWNCERLGESLSQLGLLPAGEAAAALRDEYWQAFDGAFLGTMRDKLGLPEDAGDEGVRALSGSFLDAMEGAAADFTLAFRALAEHEAGDGDAALRDRLVALGASPAEKAGLGRARFTPAQLVTIRQIATQKPHVLAQLGLTREALDEEDERAARKAAEAARDPAEKRAADAAAWDAWLLRWREAGGGGRREAMLAASPRFVLRNHVAQAAIDAAEAGDDSLVRRVLGWLRAPFDADADIPEAFLRPSRVCLKVSCSS